MIDMVITGGRVVSSSSTTALDVGVHGGRVAFTASPGSIEVEARETIDATGKFVVPGGVDPHVHFGFSLDGGRATQSADWGSKAAAFGGTTTFIDFALQHGDGSLMAAIQAKRDSIDGDNPSIDYALHCMVTGKTTFDVVDEIPEAISEGVSSFKMFTTYADEGAGVGALYADDGRIWAVMEQTAAHGGIVMVHCEDDCLISHNVRQLYRDGKTDVSFVPEARTALVEEAAIRRMLLLSQRSGSPLYICHITSRLGVDALSEARGAGTPAYGEVLHHNLSHTKEKYERSDAALYHTYPGLKSSDDQAALWEGTTDGVIDCVSSDDFTFHSDLKLAGTKVDTVSAGHNGIETRMGVLYSSAVASQKISVNRFVALTSEGPAKLFGLFPRKGLISPGSDADIVLLDPSKNHTIELSNLHSDCDYSVWDGWECAGYPTTTIAGGRTLVRDGLWVGGEGGGGNFVPCGSPGEL